MTEIQFSLNHMTVPSLPIEAFFALAGTLEMTAVEIRNDLDGNAIVDGTPAAVVRTAAEEHGLTIISINALQRFNEWNARREQEAGELIAYAAACGAEGLVLVPVCDGTGKEDGLRQENLRSALKALKPMLDAAGLTGFVEPLGFEFCSLRSKAEAVEAINAIGGEDTFRLVHDTFHHHLAGEPQLFPQQTGLIHISGVTDKVVALVDMRDPHRVLVGADDRLDNVGQIRALRAAGCSAFCSFEPFAPDVHQLADPAEALRNSMRFIAGNI